jgi:hypothetical protein
MIFEAIATRISVRGEAPAVYKEYMRITEKFIRNEFSRSPRGKAHGSALQNHPTPKKLSGTIFHASLKEVNHTDVVYKSDKKVVFRGTPNSGSATPL